MKFRAKETSVIEGTDRIWIIKDKIYDLEECNYGYIFNSESSDDHRVTIECLSKWFEEVKEPKICEILGVEVDEKFAIKFEDETIVKGYYLNEIGYLYNDCRQKLNDYIVDILNDKFKIIKTPTYTVEQKEIFKALRVLGFKWIARDKNDAAYAFRIKPIKTIYTYWASDDGDNVELRINICFDFITWEDKEPFEIPEEEI